jgi:NADH-quinone oxidoreductase subunit A
MALANRRRFLMSDVLHPIWPFLLYATLVLVLVGGMILGSYLLGERHQQPNRNIPYQSGVQPTGSARLRFVIHYYPVGVFFILFDIEAVILFAWAVAFRELGWSGYISASLFVLTLALGLAYIWKEGGLDWNPPPVRRPN